MLRNWLALRFWLLVIILAASPAGAPALAQGTTVVRVDPSATSAQVNDTVNIFIKVDNIVNLSAFELHLAFNPGILEVSSLTNGGFVAADFIAQNNFDNAAGTIDYAIAQMNRPAVQGSGTLLNIAFRAKSNGNSSVTTRATPAAPNGLLLSDQNGMAIQASWLPGSIEVKPLTTGTNTPTSTPTPTSITNTPTITSTSTPITNTPTKTSTVTPITNTPTNTPTSTNPTPPPAGTLGTHVVRFGEWLYCIARAYRVSPWAIIEVNHLWWPYVIFPNQRLTIPNVPWTNMTAGPVCQAQFSISTPTTTPTVNPPPVTNTPTATPIPATTPPPSNCRAIYIVRPGDTLYRIALRYGTTYTEIARVNGISNPRLIHPGQRLCIP
ncbi:MAG TPA: LysM peptidoglycan-binding domain-containing protein [Anaerolineales bacterium]|nr:LysM peptidoglycan-binding domain-containing protein [Anaerolineales bacterium]